MIRHITRISIWSYLAIMLLYSCGDSTSIGADIFSGEEIDVQFVDTISIKARTVAIDSFNSTISTSSGLSLLLGVLEDPVFGKTRADIVTRVDSNLFVALDIDESKPLQIDSLVLIMASTASSNYGDTTSRSISLDIFQVEEELIEDTYFSNAKIATSAEPIGSVSNYLLNFDSTLVYNPVLDSTIVEVPQIRVPMSTEFIDWFQQEVINSDQEVLEVLKGLKIKPTEENIFLTSVNFDVNAGTRFRMYYNQSDSSRIYDYIISAPAFNLIEADQTGAPVTAAFDNYDRGDSILYLQSIQGTQVELDLSNLSSLKDTYINEVQLVLTLVEHNVGDLGHFEPIPNLKASVFTSDGVFEYIEDIVTNDLNGIELLFGGNISASDQETMQYTMNITKFVKNNLQENGEIEPIFLNNFFERLPNRSVIFGPGHMLYPMKLKVTYTLP